MLPNEIEKNTVIIAFIVKCVSSKITITLKSLKYKPVATFLRSIKYMRCLFWPNNVKLGVLFRQCIMHKDIEKAFNIVDM